MTDEEFRRMLKRQREYDDLIAYYGGVVDPTGRSALTLHQHVVRIIDGQEPDPREGARD